MLYNISKNLTLFFSFLSSLIFLTCKLQNICKMAVDLILDLIWLKVFIYNSIKITFTQSNK